MSKLVYAPAIVVAMELVDTSGNGTSLNPRRNEHQPHAARKRLIRAPMLTDARWRVRDLGLDMKLDPQDLETHSRPGFTQFFGHNPVVSFCRGPKGEVGAGVRAQGRGAVPGLFFGRSALMELACGLTRRSSGRLERAPEVQLGAAGGDKPSRGLPVLGADERTDAAVSCFPPTR